MDHSILPPSSAYIWGPPEGCRGWPLMAQLYPETEAPPEAAEGTASHWAGGETLLSYQPDAAFKLCNDFVGLVCPDNGVLVTEKMAEGAAVYVRDVLAVCQERGILRGLKVEQRLQMPGIHEVAFGTSDCYVYDPTAHELFVWDYKFGFEKVEAYENWQALMYAEGVVDKLGFKGLKDQTLKISIRIVQPRAFHRDGPVREWKTDGGTLRAYTNILHASARECLGEDPVTRSGPHCKHCPGRHACEAALTAGTRLYEAAVKTMPVELSPQALGVQLAIITRARKQLEYLETGYNAQVEGLVRKGGYVPGYCVEETYGREKWDKPLPEVLSMGDMMGIDLRKPAAVTPNKARELGIDAAVITPYSTKPRTGVKVVPDNGNKAKQVFSK